jgi:ribose transport system ATP-binding protein
MARSEVKTDLLPAISVDAICKTFGPTKALGGATFVVPPGHVHALLGENGAGKSTLIKIISGLLQPDSGTIQLDGQTVQISNRREAHRLGIATAFQELTQIRNLTVTQNLLMPYQPAGVMGQLKNRIAEEIAATHLESLSLGSVSPRAEVGSLSLPERQKLEIARATLRQPKVLLLDEPTSSLSGNDIEWLGQIIAQNRARGAAVLFISHRMSEVRRYCDDMTILRSGKSVGSYKCSDISDEHVIELIIGRSLDAQFPTKTDKTVASAPPALKVNNLRAGKARDITFALQPGEIVGVAALQGMGQLDLFRALAGDMAVESGSIEVGGKAVRFNSPRDAIDSAIGVSFLPEERKTEALFLRLDGTFNATLPILSRLSRFGIPSKSIEKSAVAKHFEKVQVAARAMQAPMSSFSGGNQQKVVMAKWFMADSKIMLLFDPTRGVDVGTKHEIYLLLNEYLDQGGSIILYSTEIEEIINLCDRVLVIYGGRVVKEVTSGPHRISETDVMRATLGAEVQQSLH